MTVELYDPRKRYGAAQNAHLTYRGGPLLTSVRLIAVFIDAGSGYPFVSELRNYLSWLVHSDVLKELSEYNTGYGTYSGDALLKYGAASPPPVPPPVPPPPVPPPATTNAQFIAWMATMGFVPTTKPVGSNALPHRRTSITVQDSDIVQFLTQNIESMLLPKPDAQTLFVTFWPQEVTIDMGTDASCATFCGYHNNALTASGAPLYYAVLPFPGCAGCLGGLSALDALTSTTSHEVCESITDPVPGSGWYDDSNGEIGDICAWTFRSDNGYNVQKEWSNRQNKCI